MEIRDFDEKMKYAMDFYDQATEVLQLVHDSITGFYYTYKYDFYEEREILNPRLKKMVDKRKRELLIELGRVGEYALKYLLVMEQIYKYPNQTIEEFTEKFLYNIGEKKGVRNTYINQYHLDSSIVEEILITKEQYPLQPLHDYSYLFTILEKLFPSVVTHIQENILFNIKGHNCKERNYLTKNMASIAAFFSSIQFLSSTELPKEENKRYIEEYRQELEKSGDVFTKLRYLENNLENKQYDMNWVIYLMDQLVDYIVLTHEYNKDNPDNDIQVAYIKKKINEYLLPHDWRIYQELIYELPKWKKNYEESERLSGIANEVLEKYPKLLDSIDYAQLAIWKRFNNKEMSYDMAIGNFVNNLVEFRNNPNILLGKFPLLFPKNHIIEVDDFLREIGIDISTIEEENSSILCAPLTYLKRGYELIKNSNISPSSLFSAIDKVLYDERLNNNSIPELPLRHR